jgi:hypothetical protein
MARKPLMSLLAAAALTAAGLATLATAPAAQAAVPDTIPLTYTNHSGRSDPIYIYDIGTQLSTGKQGWADAGGTFHAWPAGGNPPTPAPDASIPGPAQGQSTTIRIPQFSGRIYFSFGQKLVFKLTTGGLVQPAVQNPSDPNHNILFDWTEYTLNSGGLWINSTQVDMFSVPYTVGVSGSSGTQTTGTLKSGGYDAFFNSLRAQPGGWANLIQTGSDGSVLRALNPGHAIESGGLPAGVMDDYVNRVWSKYSTSTLTVTPFADQPGTKYYGRVSGNTMNFTDGTGAVVTSFQKPDADSIFGCYKLLDAPNDLVRGPISRTLCAGYNRTTLLTNPNQPDTGTAGFYQDADTNYYAKYLHAQMANGNAYAFAFDDVGNHESLVHDDNPTSASISLDPFTGGGGSSGRTGPVTSGIAGKCLDDFGNATANGTVVDLWDCNGSAAQQWTSNGSTLTAGGKCLDVTGAGTANGSPVELWDCNGGGNQVWQAGANGSLVNPASGRCLDDPASATANGTQLALWDCNGGTNQRWNLPAAS